MVPVTENDNIENSDKYPTLEPMTTEGATSITYDGEANEIAAAKTIEVDFTGYKAPEIIKENEDERFTLPIRQKKNICLPRMKTEQQEPFPV